MILALLIFAAVVLSLGLAPRRKRPTVVSQPDGELAGPRERYLAGEITLEDFEQQVGEALEPRPASAPVYTERWEVHIHNAPPGHSLHIHLP
jgi:hypothetical protein